MTSVTTTQKIIINTGLSIALRILGSLLGLVSIYYLTHYLGDIGYGKYETALVYLYILNTIADLGIYNIVLREVDNEQSIFANALTLRIISLAFFYVLGLAVLRFFPYDLEVKVGIFIASLFTIANSISQLLITVLQKRLNVYLASVYEIVARVVFLTSIILLIYLHKPLTYFFGALAVSGLTMLALNVITVCRYLKIYFLFEWAKIVYILKEALPIGIIILFVFIYFKLDQVLLSYFKGPQAVGIFGLSYKIIENIIFIPGMITGLIIPILSKKIHLKQKFDELFNKIIKYFVIISLLIIIALYYFADLIIKALAPDSFNDSIAVLKILSLALFFIFLGSISGAVILVFKKQKISIPIYIAGALINVLLNFYFIPRYSYFGSAWITVLTEAFVNGSLLYLATRFSQTAIELLKLFVITLIGALLTILSLWLPYQVLMGIAAIIIFPAVLYWLKIIATDDLMEITNLKNLITHKTC